MTQRTPSRIPAFSRRALLQWGAATSGAVTLAACGSSGSSSSSTSASASPTPNPTLTQPSLTQVNNAEEAGELVEWGALQAANAGSYGIAGALIENSTGKVLQWIPNRVVKTVDQAVANVAGTSFTYDPTAHGERQLVYWYFANKATLNLPEPGQLTVVTSLDPCAMCTGTLLTAGINAAVVAMDTFSGINFNSSGTFEDLPVGPRELALSTFGYYAVDGGRAFQGSPSVVFHQSALDQATFEGCETIYQNSAGGVRDARKQTGIDPTKLSNPASDPTAGPVVAAYQAVYPGAFSLQLADFRSPDAALRQVLEDLRAATPDATNAVAYIDPFGNLLCASANTPAVSPVATAMMNVAQMYSVTRFNLVNDPATVQIAQQTLTSPKFGTFVWLDAPDPNATTTVEDLGVYGSTVESALPQTQPSNFQYYNPPVKGTIAELRQVISALPPLYSQLIKIDPQQVAGG